jgi:hypothetical protein
LKQGSKYFRFNLRPVVLKSGVVQRESLSKFQRNRINRCKETSVEIGNPGKPTASCFLRICHLIEQTTEQIVTLIRIGYAIRQESSDDLTGE